MVQKSCAGILIMLDLAYCRVKVAVMAMIKAKISVHIKKPLTGSAASDA